jgi:DDE family transposase
MKLLTQLKKTLSQHLTWHKQRIDCFANLILSMIQGSTVSLHKLAQGFQSEAKISSSFRRIQRFLKEQAIEQNQLVDLILSLLNMSNQLTLTIDRTNWKFGKKEINFLVLGAVHEGLTVPLYWIELDKKGNGSTEEHIEIIQKFIDHLGSERAKCLLADREFIGNELFKYLESNGIDFCIHLRESQNIWPVLK